MAKSHRRSFQFEPNWKCSFQTYAEALVSRLLRCEEVYLEYVLKEIFIKILLQSVRHRILSYWSTHLGSNLYVLAYDATPLRALQERSDAYSEKGSDHRRYTKHRLVSRRNSPNTVGIIRTGDSTPSNDGNADDKRFWSNTNRVQSAIDTHAD